MTTTMELNEKEVTLIARARQTPKEREAANAAQRAANLERMLATLTAEEKEAYLKRKVAVEAMTPIQRVAESFIRLKETAEKHLAKPDVAAEVEAVTVIIDGLKPKLNAQPSNLLRAPAKKGR
jgi:iron uptake system EfeUOB component EfeO/EfeM